MVCCPAGRRTRGSLELLPLESKRISILAVSAIDKTAWVLLRPQLQAFRERGWTVSIACSDGPMLQLLAEEGYATYPVQISRGVNILSHARSVLRLVRLMRRGSFDIVHVHTPVASLVGRLAAHLARVPLVVYTAHGFYFHEHMPAGRKALHIALERRFGRYTDFLFTQSAEDAATAIREHIMPPSRVVAIGNGVPLDAFAGVSSEAIAQCREHLSLDTTAVVVGIVGRLVEEKGYGEFFAAASLLARENQGVHFLVVGDVVEGDRTPFKDRITERLRADAVLRQRVRFIQHTDDIPTIMRVIDIFVLPSYREGMPRSIIEAMAAGKPVVATNIRGCREEVIDAETGYLVPVRDAAALAARIRLLLADPSLRRTQGLAGRRRAEALFSEAGVVGRLVAALEGLLRERGYAVA